MRARLSEAVPLPGQIVDHAQHDLFQSQMAAAANAQADAQARKQAAEAKVRNSLARDQWNKITDFVTDPRNPVDSAAMGQIVEQFQNSFGVLHGMPNPVDVRETITEQDDPMIGLTKARELACADPRNTGGFENRIRLDRDGNVDYSQYDRRVGLELDAQRHALTLFKETYKLGVDNLRAIHRVDEEVPFGNEEAMRDLAGRKAAFAQESRALEKRLYKDILGRETQEDSLSSQVSNDLISRTQPTNFQGDIPEFTAAEEVQSWLQSGMPVGTPLYFNGELLYVQRSGKLGRRNPSGLR